MKRCSSQSIVSLDQVTCENEARGLNCLKIQALSRFKEGTIDDRPVKNSIRDGNNVIETIYQCIEISASSRLTAACKKGCTRSNSI